MKPDSKFTRNALFYFEVFTRRCELKLLKSGYLLQRILDTAQDRVNGQIDTNIWMSLAHEATISFLLSTLGIFEPVNMIIFFQFKCYSLFNLIRLSF